MATTGTRSAARSAAARLAGLVALTFVLAGMLAPAASAVGSPDLTITKTSDAVGTLAVGDQFTYTLTRVQRRHRDRPRRHRLRRFPDRGSDPSEVIVQLPGGTCTLASSQTPGSPPANSLYCELDPMDAGAIVTIPFEVKVDHYVPCGALKNTARVRATDEPAANRDDNASSVTDDVACVPSIALETTAPTYAHVGASVPFTMRVHNDGQTSLGSVDLTGPGCSPVRTGNGNGDAALAVGESWTFRCSRHIDGSVQDRLTGTATVVAYSDTEEKVSARDSATVRVLDPGIAISVEPDPRQRHAGRHDHLHLCRVEHRRCRALGHLRRRRSTRTHRRHRAVAARARRDPACDAHPFGDTGLGDQHRNRSGNRRGWRLGLRLG